MSGRGTSSATRRCAGERCGYVLAGRAETDSFACLLLTTAEPDFERVLTRIHAREYPGEGKGEGVDILKSQRPRNYLQAMIDEGKNDPDPETRDAALRLEEKLNNYPDFKRAVEDSFLVSSGQEPRAAQAWQSLATNPYLQSPN